MAGSDAGPLHCAHAAGKIMSVTLVLGGARSGKSRFAESLAHGEKHYVATAQAFDQEMKARIAKHKLDRGAGWITHEEPLQLVKALKPADGAGRFVLVDCLTLWLTNLMLSEDHSKNWQEAAMFLCETLPTLQADVVLVSNEVGLGLVPETPLGRSFRDAQGLLNQRVAAVVNNVIFVAAGLPLVLKGQVPKAQ
jgi:adenosylcobinamide kinase / adenosylcobinamide-phosphate guanylyltransferase